MDFVTGLPQSADWRGNSYDLIYELVQTTITAPALAESILNAVISHHGLLDSIFSNCGSVFISKLLPNSRIITLKNASTGYTPFEPNCRYHRVSFEEDLQKYVYHQPHAQRSSPPRREATNGSAMRR